NETCRIWNSRRARPLSQCARSLFQGRFTGASGGRVSGLSRCVSTGGAFARGTVQSGGLLRPAREEGRRDPIARTVRQWGARRLFEETGDGAFGGDALASRDEKPPPVTSTAP